MIRSRSKNNFYRDKWVFPFLLIQKTEKLYQKEEQWLCNISDFVVLCLFNRNCEGRNIRYRTCSNTVSQYDMLWGSSGVSICRSATNLYRIEMPVVHKFIQMPHALRVCLLDIWRNLVILSVTNIIHFSGIPQIFAETLQVFRI